MVLPCSHRRRTFRLRRGHQFYAICRTCGRWFHPESNPVADPHGFVMADRLTKEP
jgi:uncharacterized OB-fold protein